MDISGFSQNDDTASNASMEKSMLDKVTETMESLNSFIKGIKGHGKGGAWQWGKGPSSGKGGDSSWQNSWTRPPNSGPKGKGDQGKGWGKGKGDKGGGKGGGGKGKQDIDWSKVGTGKWTLHEFTPDQRKICYAYNNQWEKCKNQRGACPFVHCCRYCFRCRYRGRCCCCACCVA